MLIRRFSLPVGFRRVLAALSMLVLPLSAASPSFAQGWAGVPMIAPGAIRVADAPSGLNVRAGPGTAYLRIGVLARGQGGQVTACEAAGRWCVLRFANGGEGWVYMPLTRPVATPARLGPPVDWRRLYNPDTPYIHKGTGRVNLRQGAGTHRTVVGKLYPGQGGYVRGCSADARWCLLAVTPQVEGWVYMPLLAPITAF